ncbi:MAG TPA: hypothetical protein VFO89_01330, partial [Thermoanaerobaculia bacterium]|nr:hypothetical protein [Thermoanaerobaculia bacterium]
MNSKRRAELQRRLSLNAVPRPPAGLADRIKADIPKFLRPEAEPYTRSIALNMRLAAAVLLLVSTALVAVQLLTPSAEEPLQATATAAAP